MQDYGRLGFRFVLRHIFDQFIQFLYFFQTSSIKADDTAKRFRRTQNTVDQIHNETTATRAERQHISFSVTQSELR